MIKTASISHQYDGSQRFDFPDINCKAGETILVLGHSGVGKTTLLHILAGILKPAEGQVLINETALYKLSGAQQDAFRGKNIGLIFQKPHFIASISAIENLNLARHMAGQKIDMDLAEQLLKSLNLHHRRNASVQSMSQGELQRLSIARALINKPALILADEPTSALDDKNCHEVVQLLKHHSKEVGAALVIVTHDNRLKSLFPKTIELM